MKIIIDPVHNYNKVSELIRYIIYHNKAIEKLIEATLHASSIEERMDMDKWVDYQSKVDLHFYKDRVIAYPMSKDDLGCLNTDCYTWVELINF